jgi:hypothetical protein
MKRVYNPGVVLSIMAEGMELKCKAGTSEQADDVAQRLVVKFGDRGVCILPGDVEVPVVGGAPGEVEVQNLDGKAKANADEIFAAWEKRKGAPAPQPAPPNRANRLAEQQARIDREKAAASAAEVVPGDAPTTGTKPKPSRKKAAKKK